MGVIASRIEEYASLLAKFLESNLSQREFRIKYHCNPWELAQDPEIIYATGRIMKPDINNRDQLSRYILELYRKKSVLNRRQNQDGFKGGMKRYWLG